MLSVVIPCHLEKKEEIFPLMTSLNEQVGIDFNNIEILLINDIQKEEAPLDNESFTELTNISNRIRHIKSPYPANPGLSRQVGIDESAGDYVFFCDADDSLYHLGVIRELLDNIKLTQADIYKFLFIEEIAGETQDKNVYQIKGFNDVWVFAKAYRVDFLRKNHIRFSKFTRWHEDTYFNLLCRYCEPKVINIESGAAYLWKANQKSITRINDHAYTFDASDEYMDAVEYAYDYVLKEYNKEAKYELLVTIGQYYMMLNNPFFKDREKYNEIEKRYFNFIIKMAPALFEDNLSENRDLMATMASIIHNFNDTSFMPEMGFIEYMRALRQKYNTEFEN